MREIKFRRWNTDWNNPVMGYFNWNDLHSLERLQDKIIMQFTELKDKNGKEIYEGDLVKHNKLGNFEIKFHEGAYRMGIILLCFYVKEIEVIGNIYETPITS